MNLKPKFKNLHIFQVKKAKYLSIYNFLSKNIYISSGSTVCTFLLLFELCLVRILVSTGHIFLHSPFPEVVSTGVFDAEAVALIKRHCQHNNSKQKKDQACCNLTSWALIKNESAFGPLSKQDVWVLSTSYLNSYWIVFKVNPLLKLTGVFKFLLML
jgi:hypothetical protein